MSVLYSSVPGRDTHVSPNQADPGTRSTIATLAQHYPHKHLQDEKRPSSKSNYVSLTGSGGRAGVIAKLEVTTTTILAPLLN